MLKEKKPKKEKSAKRGHVTSMGKSIENIEGSLREYLYPKGQLNKPDFAQSESGYLQVEIQKPYRKILDKRRRQCYHLHHAQFQAWPELDRFSKPNHSRADKDTNPQSLTFPTTFEKNEQTSIC